MVKRWDILTEVNGNLKAGVFVLASDYDALEARYRMLQRWWLLSDGEGDVAPDDQDFDALDGQLDDAIAKDRGGEHG